MARLNFHFTPRDTADFDVCSDPPRPEPPPAEPPATATGPTHPAAEKPPEPAEG